MHMIARQFAIALATMTTMVGNAQQPFPTYADSGSWSVLCCISGNGTTCATETFQYTGTVNMCGHGYSIAPTTVWGDTAFIRNELGRTLLRKSRDCVDREYVMYDYTLNVGDTVYCGENINYITRDTSAFVLSEVDTVTYFGVQRRRLKMLYDRCNADFLNTTMYWMEGIGSTDHPFYSLACICDFCEQGCLTLCYDSAGTQLYMDPGLNTCDTTITGIVDPGAIGGGGFAVEREDNGNQFSLLFPREFRNGVLRIIDALGRECITMGISASNNTVPTPVLRSGTYAIILVDEKGPRWCARWWKD